MTFQRFGRCAVSVFILALGACGEVQAEAIDGEDEAILPGKADTGGLGEGSAEAQAVVALVNEPMSVLPGLLKAAQVAGLARANIGAVRLGDDGAAGTADDATFASLAQLDAVPFVGPVAFAKLLAYARAHGYLATGGGAAGGGVATDDPFDPASCQGAPMTYAEALARFQPGGTAVDLGPYKILKRTRACHVTGCEPWKVTEDVACKSSGGASCANGPLTGQVQLTVNTDSDRALKPLLVAFTGGGREGTGRAGYVSPADGAHVSADYGYAFVMSWQWGGSGGLFPYTAALQVGGRTAKPVGVMTNTCVRLADREVDRDGKEEEVVLLTRLCQGAACAPPPPPDPSACGFGQARLACDGGGSTCCQAGLVTCPGHGCTCYGSCS